MLYTSGMSEAILPQCPGEYHQKFVARDVNLSCITCELGSRLQRGCMADGNGPSRCHEAGALCMRRHMVRCPWLLAALSAQAVHCSLHLHKDLCRRHGASSWCTGCKEMMLFLARTCVIMRSICASLQSEHLCWLKTWSVSPAIEQVLCTLGVDCTNAQTTFTGCVL